MEVPIKYFGMQIVQFYLWHLEVMRSSRAIYCKMGSFLYKIFDKICAAFYTLFTHVQVGCKWEHKPDDISSKAKVVILETLFPMA